MKVKITSYKFDSTKDENLYDTYKKLLDHELNTIFNLDDANELDTICKKVIKYYSDLNYQIDIFLNYNIQSLRILEISLADNRLWRLNNNKELIFDNKLEV